MQKRPKKSNLEMWRKRIQEQAASGLSISEYCELIDASHYQFHYWKRRVSEFAREETTDRPSCALISVGEIPRRHVASAIDIRIGSFIIRYRHDTDEDLFQKAASLLASLHCRSGVRR